MQEADWLTTDRKYHLLKVGELEDEISAVAPPCEANVAIPKKNCRLKTLTCIFSLKPKTSQVECECDEDTTTRSGDVAERVEREREKERAREHEACML